MIIVNKTVIEQKYFPDGTFLLFDMPYATEIPYINPTRIIWRYEDIKEQILLHNIVKHIRDLRKDADIILNMPYIPNARMDRVYSKHEVQTLKYFCEFINDLKFTNVIVNDAHSPVALALLNNVQEITSEYFINRVIKIVEPDYIFYPDCGAMSKYTKFIKHPALYGYKDRCWETGKVLSLEIIGKRRVENNATVLFVDDIIAYGGTLLASARALIDIGFKKIYACVTHVENSILNGDVINSGLIECIYTTESIFTKQHDLIKVLRN